MPEDIDLMRLFDRIYSLVDAAGKFSAFGNKKVRVRNVVFKTMTVVIPDAMRKEVKVTRRKGFLWLRKEVVFFATETLYRNFPKDYEILKYVPGEWEVLVDKIL